MDAIFDRLIPDMAKPAHKRAFSANDLRNAWQRQRKVMQEDWHKGVRQEVEMLDKQQMFMDKCEELSRHMRSCWNCGVHAPVKLLMHESMHSRFIKAVQRATEARWAELAKDFEQLKYETAEENKKFQELRGKIEELNDDGFRIKWPNDAKEDDGEEEKDGPKLDDDVPENDDDDDSDDENPFAMQVQEIPNAFAGGQMMMQAAGGMTEQEKELLDNLATQMETLQTDFVEFQNTCMGTIDEKEEKMNTRVNEKVDNERDRAQSFEKKLQKHVEDEIERSKKAEAEIKASIENLSAFLQKQIAETRTQLKEEMKDLNHKTSQNVKAAMKDAAEKLKLRHEQQDEQHQEVITNIKRLEKRMNQLVADTGRCDERQADDIDNVMGKLERKMLLPVSPKSKPTGSFW